MVENWSLARRVDLKDLMAANSAREVHCKFSVHIHKNSFDSLLELFVKLFGRKIGKGYTSCMACISSLRYR
jgi:hypothetical protein